MTSKESINLDENWVNNKSTCKKNEPLISSDYSLDTSLQQLNLTKKSKRQFTGFVLMGLGAILGFISCLLTLLNPFPEFYNLILYGLTTVAITIIFWDLYFVFE